MDAATSRAVSAEFLGTMVFCFLANTAKTPMGVGIAYAVSSELLCLPSAEERIQLCHVTEYTRQLAAHSWLRDEQVAIDPACIKDNALCQALFGQCSRVFCATSLLQLPLLAFLVVPRMTCGRDGTCSQAIWQLPSPPDTSTQPLPWRRPSAATPSIP